MTMRHFEDFEVGETAELGSYVVTKEEIVEFAEKHDPSQFSVGEQIANDSSPPETTVSGWHIVSVCMRMAVDNYFSRTAALGSPGIDTLRWHQPVNPGDTLLAQLEVLDTIPLENTSDRGLIQTEINVTNQDDEQVLSTIGEMLVECKEPPGSSSQ